MKHQNDLLKALLQFSLARQDRIEKAFELIKSMPDFDAEGIHADSYTQGSKSEAIVWNRYLIQIINNSDKTEYSDNEEFVCAGCAMTKLVNLADPKTRAFVWGDKGKQKPYCFDCDDCLIQGVELPNEQLWNHHTRLAHNATS